MSIMYCEKHDRRWDSDFLEECPQCENEEVDADADREMFGDDIENFGLENVGNK